MHIDWATLFDIAVVAAAAALAVVLLVGFALVGLSMRTQHHADGADNAGSADPGLPSAWPSPCSACSPPASSSATACTSSSPESTYVRR